MLATTAPRRITTSPDVRKSRPQTLGPGLKAEVGSSGITLDGGL